MLMALTVTAAIAEEDRRSANYTPRLPVVDDGDRVFT